MREPRDVLLDCFRAGVVRVGGREAVSRFLRKTGDIGDVYLVAVGKAAAMAGGALEVLGDKITDGIVISKTGHIDRALYAVPRLRCIESDHPLPTRRSLDAGRELISYIQERAVHGKKFLFLLSGGASSLVEVLPEGMTPDDLSRINSALLAGGLDIKQMNAARRAVSCIKGGRLAGYLNGSDALGLLISDVPGDDPGVIGSGLLTPSEETDGNNLWDGYPDEVRNILQRVKTQKVPGHEAFAHIQTHIIARLEDAKQAAAREAEKAGYKVTVHDEFIAGDVGEAAAEIADYLTKAAPGVHIWGGETSVVLPPDPGRGGRNQHMALAVAGHLCGRENIYLLAAGTDGTDGVTDDAGGIVDGATVARGEAKGLNITGCLAHADANTYLSSTGDLVHTGPTGTNVMDLIIGLVLAGN